tara:strand:+ start:300 stop:707 length:408 start_codon:yes stop_codon:yes gene_type:complete
MNNLKEHKGQEKIVPSMSWKWITFAFEHKGNQIVVRNGNWNSREQVFINDDLVHDQKSMKMQMNKSFKLPEGEDLKIDFGLSFKKGVFIEASSEEGEVFSYASNRDPKYWMMIITFVMLGAISGFLIVIGISVFN